MYYFDVQVQYQKAQEHPLAFTLTEIYLDVLLYSRRQLQLLQSVLKLRVFLVFYL